MELTWLMRLRIAAAMGVGIVLIGVLAWPLVAPAVPRGAITLFAGDISTVDTIACAVMAFVSGFLAYIVAWPYGADIAPLAAPAGIGLWAMRSGNMASLLRINTAMNLKETLASREAVYNALKWESLFWIGVVAAGFAGVWLAAKLFKAKKPHDDKEIGNVTSNKTISVIVAMIFTVVITQIAMGIFAQDVRMFDSELGSVVGQPGTGQIAFALIVSFGLAAFVAKQYLDVNYIFPAIAACGLGFYAMYISAQRDVLEYMIEHWPEAFFARSITAVLPIQLVAFGAIGVVAGYWIAVKYAWWRKHGE